MSEPTTTSDDTTDDPPEPNRMRTALTQIRREGWKIAAVYAAVDAALATLAANLVLTVVGLPVGPERVPIPPRVVDVLRETAGLSLADPTLSTAAAVGVAVGSLVFVAEVGWRVRRPLVEQFEAANPALRESLRTARDAVAGGNETVIARRLYTDVLDDLREASSLGLLDLRRVAGTLVVVALLSVATVQIAVVDLPEPGAEGPAGDGPSGGTDSDYTGLQDGSSVLGEPEDVPAGDDELDATVDTGGAGSGEGDAADSVASYDRSGFDDAESVQSQRAGFDGSDRIEDADLIREYNLRIREEDET
jgi:hypothetical protein